jgi:hypothetical protein
MTSVNAASRGRRFSPNGKETTALDRTAAIATRRYFLDPGIEPPTLSIAIGKPEADELGYTKCSYTFSGAINRTQFASGVDEIHALVSALAMAGTDLDCLNQEMFGGKLQWEAGPATSSLPTIRDHWPFKMAEP